jgi:hypothetical protein
MMGAESMGLIRVKLHFTDDKVCKNYLCGTCPHIVFTNTVSSHSMEEIRRSLSGGGGSSGREMGMRGGREAGRGREGELDLNISPPSIASLRSFNSRIGDFC